jgi:hypothetical protein
MKNLIKFDDITTVAELKSRATLTNDGYYSLSCGNRYWKIRHLLEREGPDSEFVMVHYTARSGEHAICRYFKIT